MTRSTPRKGHSSGSGRQRNSWMREHFSDEHVQRSWADGYRSRASYKLLEIDRRDRLLKPGMTAVDLGAAPGGWTQVLAERIGDQGMIVASDILEMDPVPGVTFLKGDFTEESVLEDMLAALEGRAVDLIVSDMAPNMSGQAAIDQPGAMYLVELALDLTGRILRPGGDFLVKVFQGEGFDDYLGDMRRRFDRVMTRKPEASRARSREVYLLGRGFRG